MIRKAHVPARTFRSGNNFRSETHRVALAMALLVGTSAYGSAFAAPAPSLAAATISANESDVDAGIAPGEDFFAYANGGWLTLTQIPAGKNRWSGRNEIEEKTKHQLASLIDEAAMRPPGSYQRKVADFYAAYLSDSIAEANAIARIEPLLHRIDGVLDKIALACLLGRDLRADVDPLNVGVYSSSHLFGLAVQRGIHGEKNHFAYLLQGGLGLPTRDHYLDAAPQMQALRINYQNYIGNVLGLAGFDRAAQRAGAVMALETAIARSHGTAEESSHDTNADNHWTRADFSSKAPGMAWTAFFDAAELSKQKDLVAWQPAAISGAAALVESQPLETWKDYLRFHVIDRYADVSGRAFAEQAMAIHAAAAPATSNQGIRAQRAMDATDKAMPQALGRIYVEKYFPAAAKVAVQTMLANVSVAFGHRIQRLEWMSPATKTLALSRLKTMYFGVGYPEKWPDYSRLTIDPHDAVGNLQRVSDWNYNNALAKLDQPTDITEWAIPPQTVGAIYMPLQNAYNFSAALLQAPKFDPAASDAANYGAAGAILGHELSHFVDLLGADYNDQGAMHHWWTSEDKARFDVACEPLIKQFSSYRPFSDLSLNGKLTLSENVADLGGLSAAFDAYRHALGSKTQDKNYVRQQDRQFFLGFARAWRARLSDDALRTQVTSNDHAPEKFRVSTVRNMDAWYDAFDIRPGQRLYLAPKDRVQIW